MDSLAVKLILIRSFKLNIDKSTLILSPDNLSIASLGFFISILFSQSKNQIHIMKVLSLKSFAEKGGKMRDNKLIRSVEGSTTVKQLGTKGEDTIKGFQKKMVDLTGIIFK